MGLGLLIAQSGFSQARSFFWAGVLMTLAFIWVAIAVDSAPDYASVLIWGVIALVFVGAALYRLAVWFMNNDLKVAVYREGLTLTTNGGTRKVQWREVDHVLERWQKQSYQGIVNINTHTIEIHNTNPT
jgi:hypothetical protein